MAMHALLRVLMGALSRPRSAATPWPLVAWPAPNPVGRLPFPLDAETRLADLRAAAVFDKIDHEIMPWLARFDPSQIRALYSTFPSVSGLPEPRRSEVLDALAAVAESEFGGLVERTFYTSIYIARRA
jgi:hypothetical protein